jgi:hypothetical protein
MRTYTLRVGAVPEFEKRFAEAVAMRQEYSRLGGFWHTEVGLLNQVIHVWPYDSLQQRANTRAAAVADPRGFWPPKTSDLIITQESDILEPVSTMEPWDGERAWGSIYELRMYTYAPGDALKVAPAYAAALPKRMELYPMAGIFTSQLGSMNRLYQLSPYRDWDHREEVRAKFATTGVWPPKAEARPIEQNVRILIPASFSPLH